MEPELEHTLPGVPGSQGAGSGTEKDSKRVAVCVLVCGPRACCALYSVCELFCAVYVCILRVRDCVRFQVCQGCASCAYLYSCGVWVGVLFKGDNPGTLEQKAFSLQTFSPKDPDLEPQWGFRESRWVECCSLCV